MFFSSFVAGSSLERVAGAGSGSDSSSGETLSFAGASGLAERDSTAAGAIRRRPLTRFVLRADPAERCEPLPAASSLATVAF